MKRSLATLVAVSIGAAGLMGPAVHALSASTPGLHPRTAAIAPAAVSPDCHHLRRDLRKVEKNLARLEAFGDPRYVKTIIRLTRLQDQLSDAVRNCSGVVEPDAAAAVLSPKGDVRAPVVTTPRAPRTPRSSVSIVESTGDTPSKSRTKVTRVASDGDQGSAGGRKDNRKGERENERESD